MRPRFSVPVTTAHGMLTYHREGDAVTLKLNYRDPEQSTVLTEATAAAVTAAIDTLRDRAVGRMQAILAALLKELLADPRMPKDEAEDGEFVDPQFTPAPLLASGHLEDDRLSIRLQPFYAEVSDPAAGECPNRFLATEYVRSIVRHRTAQLWAEFEHARRNLLEDLWYPPREPTAF